MLGAKFLEQLLGILFEMGESLRHHLLALSVPPIRTTLVASAAVQAIASTKFNSPRCVRRTTCKGLAGHVPRGCHQLGIQCTVSHRQNVVSLADEPLVLCHNLVDTLNVSAQLGEIVPRQDLQLHHELLN
jgi:hypothetical protein